MTPELAALLPEVVSIPGGSLQMGASASDRFANDTERPAHEVQVAPFAMGKIPVTVAQYRCFQPTHVADEPQHPVVKVSWHEAQNYCAWLETATQRRFRLPSESEWEYACRAGSTEAFAQGDDMTPEFANYLFDEHGQRVGPGSLMPASSYPANAFGLHDMHGNVCEWVADAWHSTYSGAPQDGAAWPGPSEARVIRGGAWDYMPRLLRSAWRDHLPASNRRDNVGFRVATSDLNDPDRPDTLP